MGDYLRSLAPFTLAPAESVGPRWERWVARFENYLLAANVTAEGRKKGQLLHFAGEDVFEVYLSFGSPSNLTFQEMKARLTAHFLPKRNKEYEVFKFRSSRQSSSETVDDFAMCLRQLAKHCEFADVDGEIKTQVVQTCVLEKVCEKAFMEALISLSDLLFYARSVEAVRLRQHQRH